MNAIRFLIVPAVALLSMPAFAQDWGSDYNMGSIGVLGGNSASGTISIDCAEAGNGVVEKGALSIFVTPQAASMIDAKSPGTLTFGVGDTDVSLPVSDNLGDGFVYEKTTATLVDVVALVELLKGGKAVSVTAGDEEIANIGLDGAAEALDGVEACLTK